MPFEPGELVLRRQFQRGSPSGIGTESQRGSPSGIGTESQRGSPSGIGTESQWDDLVGRVWVGRVVADDEHGLWLWIAAGSPFLDIAAADGRSFRQVPFAQWPATPKAIVARTWQPRSALMLHPPGAAHSVWLAFNGDGSFHDWYVNLEEPVIRWTDGPLSGVDTVDQDLDLVVAPDRGWVWKDEDEFAAHLAVPEAYWVDDPEAVWAEGKRVIAQVEAGGFPFDGTRTDFRPDPEWTIPAQVPPGWDRPRARA